VKRAVFHPLAAKELISSAEFYEQARAGLGERFLLGVESALALIKQRPDGGRVDIGGSLSRRVEGFPFRIYYNNQPDRVWVVAVAHMSRKPGYWARRVV
jgi:plasmid stabilization system protein ParE